MSYAAYIYARYALAHLSVFVLKLSRWYYSEHRLQNGDIVLLVARAAGLDQDKRHRLIQTFQRVGSIGQWIRGVVEQGLVKVLWMVVIDIEYGQRALGKSCSEVQSQGATRAQYAHSRQLNHDERRTSELVDLDFQFNVSLRD